MGAPLGPIQLIPPGFTGFLAIKQLGRLPDELLGQYQPSIDVRDWMFEGRREDEMSLFTLTSRLQTNPNVVTGSTGFNPLQINGVAGAANIAQVPQGQLWYVEVYSVQGFNIASGDSIRFAPAIVSGVNETMPLTLGNEVQDTAAARVHWVTSYANRAFWAPAGTQFGVVVSDVLSAGGIAARGTMRATRMQV